MDFRSLRYFVAVYEELSFSAASKRCFVAQPSISAAVQQLEAELECTLFARHSKGVTPTTEGSQLYPKACQVLEDVQSIKLQFQDVPEQVPFRLALMPFLSGKRVSRLIKELMQKIPNLDLTLLDSSQEADARIISQNIADKDDIFHKLWRDRYVLAVPQDHPLASHEAVELHQLNNCAFISRQPCDINDAWQFAVAKRGLNLKVKARVKTEEYALDLVATGLGVSIVPRHSLDGRADIRYCEVSDVQLERVVGLAYKKNTAVAPSIMNTIISIK
ncbi:MAG: LysR family transcriptional regulator [Pseudomonadales bacterium]